VRCNTLSCSSKLNTEYQATGCDADELLCTCHCCAMLLAHPHLTVPTINHKNV